MKGTLHAMPVPPSSPRTVPQAEYFDVSPDKRMQQNINSDVLCQIINEVLYEVRTQLRAMRQDVSDIQIMRPERQSASYGSGAVSSGGDELRTLAMPSQTLQKRFGNLDTLVDTRWCATHTTLFA